MSFGFYEAEPSRHGTTLSAPEGEQHLRTIGPIVLSSANPGVFGMAADVACTA